MQLHIIPRSLFLPLRRFNWTLSPFPRKPRTNSLRLQFMRLYSGYCSYAPPVYLLSRRPPPISSLTRMEVPVPVFLLTSNKEMLDDSGFLCTPRVHPIGSPPFLWYLPFPSPQNPLPLASLVLVNASNLVVYLSLYMFCVDSGKLSFGFLSPVLQLCSPFFFFLPVDLTVSKFFFDWSLSLPQNYRSISPSLYVRVSLRVSSGRSPLLFRSRLPSLLLTCPAVLPPLSILSSGLVCQVSVY